MKQKSKAQENNDTITISDVPIFNYDPISFDLAKSSFIYGPNGSGKSSISRKLAALDFDPAPQDTEVLLFDDAYIDRFIEPDLPIEGVFKIRAATPEVQDRLSQLEGTESEKGEIDNATNELNKFQDSLRSKEDSLNQALEVLTEGLWHQKVQFDEQLADFAFQGLKRSKEKFRKECLNRLSDLPDEPSPNEVEEMTRRIERVGENGPTSPLDSIPPAPRAVQYSEAVFSAMGQSHDWSTSSRLDALIKKLSHQQWVLEGISHLNESMPQCPFCQQDVDEDLENELRALLNTAYQQAQEVIRGFKLKIQDKISEINDYSKQIESLDQVDTDNLEKQLLKLAEFHRELMKQVEDKISDMSVQIALQPYKLQEPLDNAVKALNTKIDKYNRDVQNTEDARSELKSDIWNYFLSIPGVHSACKVYETEKEKINKAINSLEEKEKETESRLQLLRAEYQSLQSQSTSAEDVLNGVNSLLQRIGFTSFQLAMHEKNRGLYKLNRPDGSPVGTSLSEGEKTLISFLYFYNWVHEKVSDKSSSGNAWVLLDDPISSLDGQTLTVISHLCRKLEKLCFQDGNRLEKFILLTHNAYFFQEVTYLDRRNETRRGRLYGLIKKSGQGVSQIEVSDKKLIDSTYNLLWAEIRDAESADALSIHIPNAMRRVLEGYFSFVKGGYDGIVDSMSADLQPVGSALISWINDGSHQINWDLERANTSLDHDIYFRAFKEIFSVSGHQDHYDFMMSQ